MRLRATKTLLWLLVGLGVVVGVLRLLHGPGSVTALTDLIPWGLWKGGGVVALVALGGAGFTLAMLVYVFHRDRYRPAVRGAVLLALLAYSSVGLGLTISLVTLVVHWLHHAEPPLDAVSGLGRIAAWLLGVYLVLRLSEIVVAGEAGLLLRADWDTANFWIETLLSAGLPLALLASRRLRESRRGMFRIALCAAVGFCLNRVDVAGLATLSLTRTTYWPSWTEWAVTLGILAGAGLLYLFAVEQLAVFPGLGGSRGPDEPRRVRLDPADWRSVFFAGQRAAGARLYSLLFVVGAALSLAFVPDDALSGVSPREVPTLRPRRVRVVRPVAAATEPVTLMTVAIPGPCESRCEDAHALQIDGDRNGRHVLFDHARHVQLRGGGEATCVHCHHMNKPLERATGCSECHADMYSPTDIFDHRLHTERTGGNDGCVRCHTDPRADKVRANTTPCVECHGDLRPEGSLVRVEGRPPSELAVGYRDALHGLCVGCHERAEASATVPRHLDRCTTCHRAPAQTVGGQLAVGAEPLPRSAP